MFGLVPFGGRRNLPARNEHGFGGLFDIFNEPFFNDFMTPANWGSGSFKVDVKEKNGGYELMADLPGMKKEDISLSYENGYLTIAAQKNESQDEKDDKGNYIRRERHYGTMSRSFYIDGLDESKVKAEFKDGVLKVDLPKAAVEVQQAKQIPIS
ncbi:MAG: Hsp20/alpha crystallin family protein [Selenomonadaceae bacterium]|nr:Hsp20/alpha crystallin family protein [Selenomonadaceae bacterium]